MADENPWFTLNPDTSQWEEVMQPEVVCIGVDPNGNDCKIRGKWRHVSEMVNEMQGRISVRPDRDPYGYFLFGPNLDKLFAIRNKLLAQQPLTQDETEFLGYNSFGWWGNYSAFGQLSIYYGEDATPSVALHHFAFGQLYYPDTGGRPKPGEGSGTWRGPMVGGWNVRDSVIGSAFSGTSELLYHFDRDTLDLTLTIQHAEPVFSAAVREAIESLPAEIRDQAGLNRIGPEIRYGGTMEIEWTEVRQNWDGSFFISGNHREGTHPGPEFGILDGDFYGPNAEEFAGYFERTMGGYDLRGVFGGKRETDEE